MSDPQRKTYSWQIEMRSGANTRVDTVASVGWDPTTGALALTDPHGDTIFMAPYDTLAYAKRLDDEGGSFDVMVNAAKANDVEEAVKRVLRSHGLLGERKVRI